MGHEDTSNRDPKPFGPGKLLMIILAIETSCDETGVAVLECAGSVDSPSFDVLGNQLLSQIMAHREYGGVYPNLAKRLHGQNLIPLLKNALQESGFVSPKSEIRNSKQFKNPKLKKIEKILGREPGLFNQFVELISTLEKPDIDAIAVTQGPGLEPALWVGINFAKALSLVWDIPVIPVNHMEGHIASVLYQNRSENPKPEIRNPKQIEFPVIALLVSGAHTELVFSRAWGEYEILGQTRDDAVGEAFDKVGRMLGLPYPGGPEVSTLAEKARNTRYQIPDTKYQIPDTKYQLPRPMINSDDYDFSFSGLKTAVLYMIRDKKLSETDRCEIAREFEDSVVDVLFKKTKKAVKNYKPATLIVAGGVVANNHLQEELQKIEDAVLRIPHHDVTGDNAIMIGMAGYLNYLRQDDGGKHADMVARGRLSLTLK